MVWAAMGLCSEVDRGGLGCPGAVCRVRDGVIVDVVMVSLWTW